MNDNPHMAEGTPLGDEYRTRLEAIDYDDPLHIFLETEEESMARAQKETDDD